MESLYVCLFSNGHIKVGRSIEPQSRIAAHVDRVACMGVELADHSTFACLDNPEYREAQLILSCAAACVTRFKNEWFAGLDFEQVRRWAEIWATRDIQMTSKSTRWTKVIADLQSHGWTKAALAAECKCGAATVSRIALGQQEEPMHSMGEKLLHLHGEIGLDSHGLKHAPASHSTPLN